MSTMDTIFPTRLNARVFERVLRSGYIVSPLYDWIFFIAAPLIALALGLLLVGSPMEQTSAVFDHEKSWVEYGIGVFVLAHLVIVIFRSHLNPKIFSAHPWRFTLIPAVLFAAMMTSNWILISCAVLATFWDVYHSGMQTFGLGRIYDARAGNQPQMGRRLDWILNIYLYAGPIAAGATLLDHVDDFYAFEDVGAVFFTAVPAFTRSNAHYLSAAVIATGIPFIIFYLWSYWRFRQSGYQVSPQKVFLLLSTAACSIYAWGFNPFGMAFFIMNFFHAWQYFAIVWWAENGNLSRVLGCEGRAWGKWATLFTIVVFGLSYGAFAEGADVGTHSWLFALFLLISLMHFWYDGFIWSVARKQV